MTSARSLLSSILTGTLSQRAQGFMCVLPRGYRLEAVTEALLEEAYGTAHHPDIRRLSPEGAGNMIKVDALRDAQSFLASSPGAADMKTLVLYHADRMNENAANALLKPLEEPTQHTRILLLTDNPASLPSTIRSRCSLFTIQPDRQLAEEEVRDQAEMRDISLEKSDVHAALQLADGNPTLALDIISHGLEPWLKEVQSWLGGDDPTPPLPAVTGKSAVPLMAAAMSLQALLARAARSDLTVRGWPLQRSVNAAWHIMELCTDIQRAGIDARTRLHSMLTELRAAS